MKSTEFLDKLFEFSHNSYTNTFNLLQWEAILLYYVQEWMRLNKNSQQKQINLYIGLFPIFSQLSVWLLSTPTTYTIKFHLYPIFLQYPRERQVYIINIPSVHCSRHEKNPRRLWAQGTLLHTAHNQNKLLGPLLNGSAPSHVRSWSCFRRSCHFKEGYGRIGTDVG